MAFEDTWETVTKDPKYIKKTPKQKLDYARKFAREIVREEVGVNDPRFKNFIESNLPPVAGVKTKPESAYFEGVKEGFQAGFIPSVIGAATGKFASDLPSVFDIGEMSQIDLSPSGVSQVLDPRTEAGQYFRGSLMGQAPGLIAGGGIGSAAARATRQAFAGATPAEKLIAQTITGAVSSGAPGSAVTAASLAAAPESRRRAILEKAVPGLAISALAGAAGPVAQAASAKYGRAPVVPGTPSINLAAPTTTVAKGAMRAPTPRAAAMGRQQYESPIGPVAASAQQQYPGPIGPRVLELPAPGMTSGPRIISQRALEGQVVSPEVGAQQVMDLRNARIQAEASLDQLAQTPVPKAKPQADARLEQIRQAEGQVNLLREAELNTINAADAAARQRQFGERYTQAQNLAEETAARRAQQELRARQQQEANQYLELINQANTRLSAMERVPPAARTAEQQGAIDAMTNQVRQIENRLMSLPQEFWAGTRFAPDLFGPTGRFGTPEAQARLGLQDVAQTMEITGPYGLGGFQASRAPVPPTPERGRVPFSPEMMQMPQQRFGEEVIPGVTVPPQGMMSRRYVRDVPGLAIPQRPPGMPPAEFEEVILPTTPRRPFFFRVGEQQGQPNLIQRLLEEEEGAVTGSGALGALGAPFAAVAGQTIRAIGRGASALRSATQSALTSSAGGRATSSAQLLGDIFDETGKFISTAIPPQVAAAIAKVSSKGGTLASDAYNAARAAFPSAANAFDDVRRFTITNYGKPQAYLELEEAASAAGRKIENDLANFGNRVLDVVGDDDIRMRNLHKDMTSETYVPGSNAVDDALVMEGRQLTADVGAELVRIGALSKEAYAQWGGRYLPRIYSKILAKGKDSSATNAFARFIEDDPTLSGYYHRGKTEYVNDSVLAKRLASGEGWKAISAPTRIDPKTGKPMTKIWRDWTEGERDSWGELKNVATSLERYARAASREVRNGTFLEGVRTGSDAQGAWAVDAKTITKGPNRPREFVDSSGNRYVYIGDAKRKSGPIKAYGTLSDHYVRDDIAMHVRTAAEFAGFKQGTRLAKKITGVNWWKKLVTIGNPSYFVNNFFVNMPMLELAGGSIADLPKAARMLATNDPLIAELVNRGLIQDQKALRELASRVSPVLEKAAGTSASTATGIASVLSKTSNALKKYESGAYGIAGASDDLYRVALVEGLLRRKKVSSIDEAVEMANLAFYNRERVKAPVVDLLEPIIPFAAVTHWTMSSVPALIMKNPGKAAYLASIASALPYVAEWYYNIDRETAAAREELLPPQMRRGIIPGIGIPSSIPTGYDEQGRPTYLDLSSLTPLGNVLASAEGFGPTGSWPRALTIGGPLTWAAQYYTNRNWARPGEKLVPVDERTGERTALDETLLSRIPGVGQYAPQEVRDFMYRNVVPGIVRFPYEAARDIVAGALPPKTAVELGLTTGQVSPVSTGNKLLRAVGVKQRAINLEEALANQEYLSKQRVKDITKSQNSAYRRYERALKYNNQAEAERALLEYEQYEVMKQLVQMQEDERAQKLAPALNQ